MPGEYFGARGTSTASDAVHAGTGARLGRHPDQGRPGDRRHRRAGPGGWPTWAIRAGRYRRHRGEPQRRVPSASRSTPMARWWRRGSSTSTLIPISPCRSIRWRSPRSARVYHRGGRQLRLFGRPRAARTGSRRLREYLPRAGRGLSFERPFRRLRGFLPATSVNAVLQVGHNTLRLMTSGLENRAHRPARARHSWQRLLDEALTAGAWGLSPAVHRAGQLRRTRDLALPGCSAPRRRYPRNPRRGGSRLRGGARGDRRGRGHSACTCRSRTSSSRAWTTGPAPPGSWRRSRRRAGRGLPVDCDAYPYDICSTNPLRNLLPLWLMEGWYPGQLGAAALALDDVTRIPREREVARKGSTGGGRIPSWDVVLRGDLAPHARRNAGSHASETSPAPRGGGPNRRLFADYVVADHGETRIL